MIPTRVEKIKFVIEDMQLALHLTRHITDPFVARTLARHIIVRAKDFIEHTRGLRKPLNIAGYDTQIFHQDKEYYASTFEEYFQLSRDRLAAHVQDFDFGKRISLWNDIELVKIHFFVEFALHIYQGLEPLNLPGYVSYASLVEVDDSAVLEVLRQYQRTLNNRTWTEIGTDPLALSRNNTHAVINTTPVHARAGQIALIRRWIAIQLELLDRLGAHRRIALMLKARIVTDIVAFFDCLVTRPVAPGVAQAMDGLDKLVAAANHSAAPIDNFVSVSNFEGELGAARVIRDVIGAHLEVDETRTITSLIGSLDAYDLAPGLRFYSRGEAIFKKLCHSILFLRTYAADGQRLYGVHGSGSRAVPYTSDVPPGQPEQPSRLPIDDEESYRQNLTRWLDGDNDQKPEARDYFWHAFLHSVPIEAIEEDVAGHKHQFRQAHQFLYSTLASGLSDSDFRGVLDLMLSCRNGDPYALAEVLVRYGPGASVFRQWPLCYALGELSSSPHASVDSFLEAHSRSLSWPIRLEAARARFKRFVKAEGLFRINHQGRTRVDYDSVVASLVDHMSETETFICLLSLGSFLGGPRSGVLAHPFKKNYDDLREKIERLCHGLIADDSDHSKAGLLRQLLQTNDYVGLCVLAALDLDGGERHPLHAALIEHCCNGSIEDAGHEQALRHLASCFYMKKEYAVALEISQELAARNPEWLDIQVLVAEILGETPGAEQQAAQRIAYLRNVYKLTAELEQRVRAVEAEIDRRHGTR